MLGIASFVVSIVAVLMSFFAKLRLASFGIAILAIVIAVLSAYEKDLKENKDGKKDSRALEVGAIIIAGAACVSYYAFLFIA